MIALAIYHLPRALRAIVRGTNKVLWLTVSDKGTRSLPTVEPDL
jgi:hypothetical protein